MLSTFNYATSAPSFEALGERICITQAPETGPKTNGAWRSSTRQVRQVNHAPGIQESLHLFTMYSRIRTTSRN